MPAAAPRMPEMSAVAPPLQRREKQPFTLDTRRPSDLSTSQSSPAGTLSPFLKPDCLASPQKVYSPSRESFVSKASISEASNARTSPSSPSSTASFHDSKAPSDRGEPSRRANGHHSSPHSPHPSHRPSRDIEEYAARGSGVSNLRRSQGPSTVISSEHTTITYTGGDDWQDARRELEGKAASFLIYLAIFATPVSFVVTIYTLICLLIFLLAQPLRLIRTRPSRSAELASLLSPALRLQLKFISSHRTSDLYSAPMLLLIHTFSPFVALGVMVAAGTAACFWFFSAILGDPAGRDGHNDGKAAVVKVRDWWESWLCRGLR